MFFLKLRVASLGAHWPICELAKLARLLVVLRVRFARGEMPALLARLRVRRALPGGKTAPPGSRFKSGVEF